VFSAPPLGCLPSQRTLAGGLERKIVVNINNAVQIYNSKLSKELDSLNHNLQDSRIVYIDVYNPLFDIIVNYNKYGNLYFRFNLKVLINIYSCFVNLFFVQAIKSETRGAVARAQ